MIKTLDGRDLRHVRPQPRFPQRDGHRAGRRRAGIRPQRPSFRRQYPRLSRPGPRERSVHDAHAAQPAGRSLAPGRAPGKGPRGENRTRNRRRHRHQRRAHGLDPVRLCRRDPGHALDLPADQRGGRALCVRLCDPGRGAGAALRVPPVGGAPERRLADGFPAVVTARRGRRAGGVRRCAGAVGARLHPSRPRDVQRPVPAHPGDAAGHAPDLDKEPRQIRVHDGARASRSRARPISTRICMSRACSPS